MCVLGENLPITMTLYVIGEKSNQRWADFLFKLYGFFFFLQDTLAEEDKKKSRVKKNKNLFFALFFLAKVTTAVIVKMSCNIFKIFSSVCPIIAAQ